MLAVSINQSSLINSILKLNLNPVSNLCLHLQSQSISI